MTNRFIVVLVTLGLVASVSGAAQAQTNFVTNGDFEQLTNISTGNPTTTGGQMGFNINATGWATTNSGYNFVFTSGSADTTGEQGQFGTVELWGPNNGSANGLPASSPSGGNFVAADGAFQTEAITQTVTHLTPGQTYQLGFYWAGAQQSGFTGPTSDLWTASLGNQSFSTSTVFLPSNGFSNWQFQTFDFTATSASEELSFLATGTPDGEPPFALLDGVTLTAVPEPSTVAVMIAGALGLCLMIRRRATLKKAVLQPLEV